MPIIEVKNLNVVLGENKVLEDISFCIEENEIAVVIGPNGSGKTTLFKALLGLIPFQGKVRILNKNTKQVLNKVGYVPQRVNFDRTFPITAKEFLLLSSNASGKRIDFVLKEVGMTDYRNQLIGSLSGGQLQRILIARAIINMPKILFLDEPTSGIDIEGVKDFYSIISHLNSKHKVTVVMISHEVSMVYKFANKIICLNKNLVCHGKPEQVLTHEVLEKLYGEKVGYREHQHN